MRKHFSDCSLHNLPARWPMPCDCGGYTGAGSPVPASKLVQLREVWFARWHWKRENGVGLWGFVREALKKRWAHYQLVSTEATDDPSRFRVTVARNGRQVGQGTIVTARRPADPESTVG